MNSLYLELHTKWRRLQLATKTYDRYLLHAVGQKVLVGCITDRAKQHLDRALSEVEQATLAYGRAVRAIDRDLKKEG